MEETKPRPGFPGDRAQVAAEKLRALRERANQALDEHRQRLAQIESELSLRVRQLAEEFETASAGIERHSRDGRDDEVAALREQLEEGRAKHDKFVEQLGAARRQLDAIQAQPCVACQDAAHQLADAQTEIGRLREQAQAAQQKHEEDQARHDKFAEQVAAARQAISELQSKSLEQAAQLQTELESARAAKAAAEEQLASLARDMGVLHAEYDALQDRTEHLEQERTATLDEQRRTADAEIASQREQLAALKNELETVERAHAALLERSEALQGRLANVENERDALARQQDEADRSKAGLESELAELKAKALCEQQTNSEQTAAAEARQAELQERLTAAEAEKATLTAALAEAASERCELESSIDAAQRQVEILEEANVDLAALRNAKEQVEKDAAAHEAACKELNVSLERVQTELAELRDASCPRSALEDLQQKFDLALADVQKLKRENGQLREDLASRPEASDQESPELVAVRTERDTLALRVKELENTAAAADSNAAQDVDDLHRRFEMAVDDVRQLKQENAKLRDQLAQTKTGGPAAAPQDGSNDWAAQRARLMAMLEQEEGDGPLDSARKKERASIEKTIETTNHILAEKEREIAELKAAHESQTASTANDRLHGDREEMLDADELIAAERKRLAALQVEWEQKLRAAELEFAVERAKLAREQSALKERLFDLQKLELQGGPAAEAVDHKQPRRRWLAALGLGEEGDEPSKPK